MRQRLDRALSFLIVVLIISQMHTLAYVWRMPYRLLRNGHIPRSLDRTVLRSSTSAKIDSDTKKKCWVEDGHAYYVATPLGNVADLSPRARDILAEVDIICAEDTRNTITLLRRLQIPYKTIISHHEYNQHSSIDRIAQWLQVERKSIALVSDAGTPGISDPGTPLARALGALNIPVHAVPGPSALTAALSIAGVSAIPSTFFGFLPAKGSARSAILQTIDATPLRSHTIVLFEAPHRILRTLRDLAALSACQSPRSRPIVCCRELTKLHEEILRGDTVQEVLSKLEARVGNDGLSVKEEEEKEDEGDDQLNHQSHYDDENAEDRDLTIQSGLEKQQLLKGEFTIVLGPVYRRTNEVLDSDNRVNEKNNSISESIDKTSDETLPSQLDECSTEEEQRAVVIQRLCQLRDTSQMRRSQAIKTVTADLKLPRSLVYSVALSLPWLKESSS